jgi:NADPH2:quinone reductase
VEVLPLLAAGDVKILVDSTFPLAQAADAHRRIESSNHIGKVILTT